MNEMKDEDGRLSESLEDYLKEIYILMQKSSEVRVTDIAEAMNISKPSVNRAMNTLKELQMLDHEHYGKIMLTESGMAAAKNVVDNYRAVYKFLTDVLGTDEETAAEEADRIEHDISKNTRKKLKKFNKSAKKKS